MAEGGDFTIPQLKRHLIVFADVAVRFIRYAAVRQNPSHREIGVLHFKHMVQVCPKSVQ